MVLKNVTPRPKHDPLAAIKRSETIECGTEARKHFAIAEGYHNLNHGRSFLKPFYAIGTVRLASIASNG